MMWGTDARPLMQAGHIKNIYCNMQLGPVHTRPNRFSFYLISEIFMKNRRVVPNFMMIGKPEVVIII
jgi:hypothetical protein